MTDRLQANQRLNVNDQLMPPNGRTRLIMQADGNLVLYRNDTGSALWASNTYGKPVNVAIMQSDGNFVCYAPGPIAYWASGTWGQPGAYVDLQDDGNLVVYSSNNNPLWASNTVQNWDPMTTDSGDVHVGTGNWMHSWASMNSTGLISGHTRTWCTVDLRGFHGSVFPVLLDGSGKAVWPTDPQAVKNRYGVDGVWTGTHDRTDYWTDQVDASVLPRAKSLACVHFYDPQNMFLTDLPIIAKTVAQIVAAIATLTG